MKTYRFGFILCLSLLAGTFPAWAGVVNQGNDAVQIEFQKSDGLSESTTLFPGQARQTPEKTVSMKVVARGSGMRGDEQIKIRVVEANGKEGALTKYDQVYRLGVTEDTEVQVVLKSGRLVNLGNVALDIALKKKDGTSEKIVLYLDQTLTFPRDTYEVEILSLSRLRGDEIIRVGVMMPDGVGYTLTSPGSRARILPENMAALNNL